MRYFIEFAYDGSSFFGYQIQPNQISVQEELEKALSTILREPVKTTGAGRTDTGVHAKKMFAHFETGQKLDENLAFIEKFPCPDCRPCLGCTFYYDIPCTCVTCKRQYHI